MNNRFCTNCHSLVNEGWATCKNCGHDIFQEEDTAPAVVRFSASANPMDWSEPDFKEEKLDGEWARKIEDEANFKKKLEELKDKVWAQKIRGEQAQGRGYLCVSGPKHGKRVIQPLGTKRFVMRTMDCPAAIFHSGIKRARQSDHWYSRQVVINKQGEVRTYWRYAGRHKPE